MVFDLELAPPFLDTLTRWNAYAPLSFFDHLSCTFPYDRIRWTKAAEFADENVGNVIWSSGCFLENF